ncbi:restriction endonuclease [Spirosoma validum]|uniref:Restriction endonuclease n=1 Tax=Spirosoma validum TaxID=2771355 RepID=A0A927GGN5_9BACT|nr:restriction endonuclease [Spirosoma validum]MBD2757177.1 restriction endonuclease [Spirosoma validum]
MPNRISPDGKALEKLVSRIYEALKDNSLAEVEHDIKLRNINGDLSQFDVIIRCQMAGYPVMIAIECKDYEGAVPVKEVRDFIVRCTDVKGIARKIFVAVNGYQSGAVSTAQQHDIELYHLQEFSADLLKSWVRWERSYTAYPEKNQIGAIRFHTYGGGVIGYLSTELANLSTDLILQSPGVESVKLYDLISSMSRQEGFAQGLLKFAGEDFRKLTISGDEKTVTIPIPIHVIPEVPYVAQLESYLVQIEKVEVVFDFIYRIAPFEQITARSYYSQEGEPTAQVLEGQTGEFRVEIIKNIVNGQTSYFVVDPSGQIHKLDERQVRNA